MQQSVCHEQTTAHGISLERGGSPGKEAIPAGWEAPWPLQPADGDDDCHGPSPIGERAYVSHPVHWMPAYFCWCLHNSLEWTGRA